MSPVTALREGLDSGKPLLSAWCGIPEPAIPALLAKEDFDLVTLDMQHGAVDFAQTLRALPLIAATGKPMLARIPVGDFATASRLLDAGACGVIAPMINTLDDAQRFARAMKFPPKGERSWGPHAALALSGLAPDAYFAQANAFSIALAMVETRESLAIIDEILATSGIDGVFIGPADLSIALSDGRGGGCAVAGSRNRARSCGGAGARGRQGCRRLCGDAGARGCLDATRLRHRCAWLGREPPARRRTGLDRYGARRVRAGRAASAPGPSVARCCHQRKSLPQGRLIARGRSG